MTSHRIDLYDEYKDSEIKWLGNIPKHWNIKRLKDVKANIVNAFVDGPFGSNLKTEHFVDDGEVYVIDSGFITSGKFEKHREFKTITFEHFLTVQRSECREDDIIIAKIGANFGMSGILPKLDKPSLVSGNTLKLSLNRKIVNLKFVHYQLLNLKTNGVFDALVKGSAQPALSLGLLNTLPIPATSLHEQQAIADYLDAKTKQIDRKIELLEAKAEKYADLKQALINETVTRGLDKTVPMKDSGVEWIGQIPSHWETIRIKDFAKIVNGATPKSDVAENWDGDYAWVTPDDLGKLSGKFILNTKRTITKIGLGSCGTTLCPAGSVILSSRAPIGYIGILDIQACTNQGCRSLVLNKRLVNNLFVFYCLLITKKELESLGKGTTFFELSTKELSAYKIPFPPLQEQKAIAEHLEAKTAHIEKILETIHLEIEKLKELRKTLINDVVTGKIKVTGRP